MPGKASSSVAASAAIALWQGKNGGGRGGGKGSGSSVPVTEAQAAVGTKRQGYSDVQGLLGSGDILETHGPVGNGSKMIWK
eukprot:5118947-Alexandrium_andersonii.AAC.1